MSLMSIWKNMRKCSNKGKVRRVSSDYRWLEGHVRGLKQKYERAKDADKEAYLP